MDSKVQPEILVVDDDPSILDALEFTLQDAGYRVRTSAKGDFLEELHTQKKLPDLIILDVMLSGRDGRILCKHLKQQLQTRNVPIILISAHLDAKESSENVGADAFLAKPFEIDELLDRVKKFTYLPN